MLALLPRFARGIVAALAVLTFLPWLAWCLLGVVTAEVVVAVGRFAEQLARTIFALLAVLAFLPRLARRLFGVVPAEALLTVRGRIERLARLIHMAFAVALLPAGLALRRALFAVPFQAQRFAAGRAAVAAVRLAFLFHVRRGVQRFAAGWASVAAVIARLAVFAVMEGLLGAAALRAFFAVTGEAARLPVVAALFIEAVLLEIILAFVAFKALLALRAAFVAIRLVAPGLLVASLVGAALAAVSRGLSLSCAAVLPVWLGIAWARAGIGRARRGVRRRRFLLDHGTFAGRAVSACRRTGLIVAAIEIAAHIGTLAGTETGHGTSLSKQTFKQFFDFNLFVRRLLGDCKGFRYHIRFDSR
ncbi:hypothetical protein [Chromobacterium haemolyticum]|uniref:hypothetical protein n=1 Tax=Chromobacterium haemolyticum TaxID=394935 RepID=UPI000DEEA930|nr:hypothetical protein [Chromobacterium haemolyticum]